MKFLRAGMMAAVVSVALLASAGVPAVAGEICIFGICIPIGKPTPPTPPNGPGHAAPGPLLGVGLPFAVVGLGAAWLIRRRRETA